MVSTLILGLYVHIMCVQCLQFAVVQDAVLSQRGPRDAAVNFDTYRSLIAAASRSFYCHCTVKKLALLTIELILH